MSKSAKKRNARKMRNQGNAFNTPYSSDQNIFTGANATAYNRLRSVMNNTTRGNAPRLTPAGMSFLKCAFAPPDFNLTGVTGIPDDSGSKTLLKKHRYTGTLQAIGGATTYLLLAPMPGVAFWSCQTSGSISSVTTLSSTRFSDTTALFGAQGDYNRDQTFNAFRYVSNHIKLQCLNNMTNFAGSLQVFRINLREVETRIDQTTNVAIKTSFSGLESANTTFSPSMYTSSVIDGVFTGAYSSDGKFTFSNICPSSPNLPLTVNTTAGDFGQLLSDYSGMDNNFETTVIKITVPLGAADQNFIVNTWACVDYRVLENNALNSYTTISPDKDELALNTYRKVKMMLPVAVKAADNDTFWERVLKLITTISGGLSFVPGPYGMVAGGVNSIARGVSNIML